jgi:streptogramin lyase
MRTTSSIWIRNLFALCVLAVTSLSAQAQVLREWALPAGSQPLQIDASSPSGRVYFVDQALSTINQLGASVLTSWPAPFTPSVPGSIVVDQFAATHFVYVTDLPGTMLGQLDIIANVYFQYDLTLLPWNISGGPRQLVYDNSHSIEPNDDVVWFSASGDPATGSTPVIGYLVPATSMFRVWFIPASVASPGEAIDGLAFVMTASGPTVFFTVNSPAGGHNNVDMLLPLFYSVTSWPLPPAYTQPVPIVATGAGEVYRVQCAGCNTMARIRTTASVMDEWSSPVDTTDMFLTLDAAALSPRFTGRIPGSATADLLVTTCPSVTTPLIPSVDDAPNVTAYLDPIRIPVQPIIQDAPSQERNLDSTQMCPFFRWLPISSGGPISMDNLGGTWISETAAQFIANF